MGVTYRFIADPSEPSEVLSWFRDLKIAPELVEKVHGVLLYFRESGPLQMQSHGTVDFKRSPVVSVVLPRVQRGVLWTVGEVHFLATPLREQFPALHKISSAFATWLASYECVFTSKGASPYAYYLEGSVMNFDPPVFAFPSGIRALRAERYFISDDDTEYKLDQLCKNLRLRGVECT